MSIYNTLRDGLEYLTDTQSLTQVSTIFFLKKGPNIYYSRCQMCTLLGSVISVHGNTLVVLHANKKRQQNNTWRQIMKEAWSKKHNNPAQDFSR